VQGPQGPTSPAGHQKLSSFPNFFILFSVTHSDFQILIASLSSGIFHSPLKTVAQSFSRGIFNRSVKNSLDQ
jgi:hypothetical protein